TVFDPWKQSFYDQNDTIRDTAWFSRRVHHEMDDELRASEKDPVKEAIAAEKSGSHYNTPLTLHLDLLGRPILLIENNGTDASGNEILYHTEAKIDIEGNLRSVTDARGNTVMLYKYDMLGNKVYQQSMDAGQ